MNVHAWSFEATTLDPSTLSFALIRALSVAIVQAFDDFEKARVEHGWPDDAAPTFTVTATYLAAVPDTVDGPPRLPPPPPRTSP